MGRLRSAMLLTARGCRFRKFDDVVHVGSFTPSHMFHMGPMGDATLEVKLKISTKV